MDANAIYKSLVQTPFLIYKSAAVDAPSSLDASGAGKSGEGWIPGQARNDVTHAGEDVTYERNDVTHAGKDGTCAGNDVTCAQNEAERAAVVPIIRRTQVAGGEEDGTIKKSLTVEAENAISGYVDLRPRLREVPLQYKELVDAKVEIVTAAMAAGDLEAFQQSLSRGLICAEQKNMLGKSISLRSLYRWVKQYKEEGALGLVPGYRSDTGRGRRVPEEAQNMLLKLLLHPNQVAAATAVRYVQHHYKRVKRQPLECSARTMQRWIEDWRRNHLPEWTLARKG